MSYFPFVCNSSLSERRGTKVKFANSKLAALHDWQHHPKFYQPCRWCNGPLNESALRLNTLSEVCHLVASENVVIYLSPIYWKGEKERETRLNIHFFLLEKGKQPKAWCGRRAPSHGETIDWLCGAAMGLTQLRCCVSAGLASFSSPSPKESYGSIRHGTFRRPLHHAMGPRRGEKRASHRHPPPFLLLIGGGLGAAAIIAAEKLHTLVQVHDRPEGFFDLEIFQLDISTRRTARTSHLP